MDDAAKLRKPLGVDARAIMEGLNAEAAHLSIWLRTQANAPAQRPWFHETGAQSAGVMSAGRVGAGQMKAAPHLWKWREISPYLDKISRIASEADVPPVEFADRQQFLLTNPGLGGRLQAAASIRCAVSIYNPGDLAKTHLHSPNASRTILSESGGYTDVEGERCLAARGDLILTPNGTWHGHGNDGTSPVIWIDTLDWPLMEFLDVIWLDEEFSESARARTANPPAGFSQSLYGRGGLKPSFAGHQRGIGKNVSPMFQYRGADTSAALSALRSQTGDAFEGIHLDFVNPANGGPVFPTLGFGAQLIRAGEETALKRETSSTVYVCLEGRGQTEIGGKTFDWEENDIFVAPNFLWRRHVNKGAKDAVLYTMNDTPLLEKIGQYRAQGMSAGKVTQIG